MMAGRLLIPLSPPAIGGVRPGQRRPTERVIPVQRTPAGIGPVVIDRSTCSVPKSSSSAGSTCRVVASTRDPHRGSDGG